MFMCFALWVGRFLVSLEGANGGEIITALFAVILSGPGLNQAATNFYSFEQGRIVAYRLFEMISRSTSTINQDGNTLILVQGNIEFRNVYFSYLSCLEIPILSGFYLTVPARKAVALVGRNGFGKSNIIPLMECFYDPTLGYEAVSTTSMMAVRYLHDHPRVALQKRRNEHLAIGKGKATEDGIDQNDYKSMKFTRAVEANDLELQITRF